MRTTFITLVALLAGFISAHPRSLEARNSQYDPRFAQWAAPGLNDVRSPCPGLNALANHGFLHRDGRNMTLPHLILGIQEGLNVGADFSLAIGALGLLASPINNTLAFDLNDLDQHNFPIEYDDSLSRKDAYFGDNHDFDYTTFNEVLSYFNGSSHTSLLPATKARWAQLQKSRQNNPTFTYGALQFILNYGNNALYMATMSSNPFGFNAPLDYVEMFFEQEKLPFELGWRPSTLPITLPSLSVQILTMLAVSPEPIPEVLGMLTSGSIQMALGTVNPALKAVGNLTELLSDVISGKTDAVADVVDGIVGGLALN